MINVIELLASRDYYDAETAAKHSITVGELINELRNYDEDTKIIFSNDNGYTYGVVTECDVFAFFVETEEDRKKEQEEWDRGVYENGILQMNIELTELEAIYENATPDDEDYLTDKEYREERERIFDSYGISEEEFEKSLAQILDKRMSK